MHFSSLALAAAAAAGVSAQTNTALQTKLPASSGTSALAAVKTIVAGSSFDGKMVKYDRSPSTCNDQAEGGDADAVFLLADGATLSNVILGPNNGEGVHCLGACTLNNVWWQDVCEDAATFKGTAGKTSYVNGGGAFSASDKILQHNGNGKVAVKNFYAKTFGKLYRSCGNCSKMYKRESSFDNVKIESGSLVAGVNSNYGDVTTISNSCVLSTKGICDKFKGNDNGDEPTKVGSGADGVNCITSNIKTSGC